MTGFERATLRWAKAAVIMSLLAAIFVCLQWWEMRSGGKDTHELAVAAGNQANWMQQLAVKMETQSERTKDLADRMKDQADRTKDLVGTTKSVATAAKTTAGIERKQFEATSANRAILDIDDLKLEEQEIGKPAPWIGRKDGTVVFQFRLKNTGPTQATNIHYSLEGPYDARWDRGDHSAEIRAALNRLRAHKSFAAGSVPDMLGNEHSKSPLQFPFQPVSAFYLLRSLDEGDFFIGTLTFDDLYQNSWQRTFCVVIGAANRGTLGIRDCGIPEEEMHRTNPKLGS